MRQIPRNSVVCACIDGGCVVAGRERRHLLEGAAARDARHGPEPHRGRAQQHGDGGGPGRERDHRVPGVPRDDEAEGKGRGPGGRTEVNTLTNRMSGVLRCAIETLERNFRLYLYLLKYLTV